MRNVNLVNIHAGNDNIAICYLGNDVDEVEKYLSQMAVSFRRYYKLLTFINKRPFPFRFGVHLFYTL
jgi:hypothetical protein